jgi:cytochrome c
MARIGAGAANVAIAATAPADSTHLRIMRLSWCRKDATFRGFDVPGATNYDYSTSLTCGPHQHSRTPGEDGMDAHARRISALVAAGLGLGASASLAAGDAERGKAAFVRQCAICHTVEKDGPNRFGPNLFGILGRKAGTVRGFTYSRTFKAGADWSWNEDLVAGWIGAPGMMVPGTAMGVFQGVAQSDRDDIVAYLAAQH